MNLRSLLCVFVLVLNPPPDHSAVEASQDQADGQGVLHVGVRQLPKYLSPALACTYAEKQAAELIFDSLLSISYNDKTGQTYRPVLAKSLPQLLPGGRRFILHPNAKWADGQPVTPGDVLATIELLRNAKGAPQSFLWNEVLKPPKIGNNPRQVDFRYRQTFYEPLRPFTFKLLPQSYRGKPLVSVRDPEFAMKPVGSGPYRFQPAREHAAFVANKEYAETHGLSPFPVHEIRFHVSNAPFKEFTDPNNPIHLLPDVSEETAAYLKWQNAAKIDTAKNNRVCFLAVNHRKAVLQNQDLRLALATALNREEILNQCFRGKDPAYQDLGVAGAALESAGTFLRQAPSNIHHALNGPFPVNSWAVAPAARVPAKLHDAERALSSFEKAKEDVRQVSLSLKYPSEDPRAKIACEQIVRQWNSVAEKINLTLKIKLAPMGERELCQALNNRDYDLAYYYWDYTSEYYWLWPLFDPGADAVAANGSNFLGYKNDATLVSMMRVRMGHRDFRRVKEISHEIHAHLHDRMPFIPLWQLDMHVAVHPHLETGAIEPLRIFQNVGKWKLEK